MKSFLVRPESPQDLAAISSVIDSAFESHPFSKGHDSAIVRALREAGALTVSLVAEIDGRIVGHVAISPVTLNGKNVGGCGLGPVSVLPPLQRRGIGSALVWEALTRASALNLAWCVALGDPAYYRRFGFEYKKEIVCAYTVPPANFLIRPFADRTDTLAGKVEYHPAFVAF